MDLTYALQQANNPSNQLLDDWYWVETHILKQALATCNSYGTIMKVPYVANELLWWMAIQNMGETALLAHIMELNVLQVKRGEVRCMIHTSPMPHTWWTRDPTHLDGYDHQSLEEVLQEAKEFFVGVEEGKDSLPLLCDMNWMPSDSIGQLIESCDEMIHQEEEICQLHGVMEFCSEWLTLFDRLGQVQDQLEDF
ncbi:hypothetical protein F5J12DRAFT_784814 [Pisolithus orientalis]|uniref:uncharacterized protein n=1 Tax=Pisolithus orientalis TaxID=936130 RepID=UPI0022247F9A|nr:uncharacterized protein F5J12DRAFT_784814 [Pisolithus orientalis]KAI5998972.1 hypothetical protein F5J12DRAFT_784814 [Pisolithus orientalis]